MCSACCEAALPETITEKLSTPVRVMERSRVKWPVALRNLVNAAYLHGISVSPSNYVHHRTIINTFITPEDSPHRKLDKSYKFND
jgi:hypothetical protein